MSQALTRFVREYGRHPELYHGKAERMKEFLKLNQPRGCGDDYENVRFWRFRDVESLREWEISGLCQKCQDEVFGEKES